MPESVDVLIASSGGSSTAPRLPVYAHPGDAGADLTSAEAVSLAPGERQTIGTGVSIALPDGFAAFVLPRSGLASRHGITVVNSPGTVDAGYRGEIRVTLLNTDSAVSYSVAVGDRIAQLVVMPVATARFIPVAGLPGSQRGSHGFGSTGRRPTIGATDDAPRSEHQDDEPESRPSRRQAGGPGVNRTGGHA